jgi:lysophospholipid acyltransferase (LPLAT)-like uncharacterized protein
MVVRLMGACAATHRFRVVDPHGSREVARQGPVIFAIWHNRLAFSVIVYRRLVKREYPSRRMAALVSASRDGALLTAMLEASGVQPVRGSTSRRGHLALLELTTWAARGYDLAVTPDGPRGPRYRVQPGAVALARYTRLPLLPISMNIRWKAQLRSWDRFQVPLPFGLTQIELGPALRVPDGDEGTLHAWQEQLQRELTAITRYG